MTIKSFETPIPPRYFYGYRITKPFSARVSYEADTISGKVKIKTVTFTPECLSIISNLSGLMLELGEAAVNNFESSKKEMV